MKKPDARYRPWVKLRLPDSKDARRADGILKRWRQTRTASTFLVRAVRVYDALLRGDKDEFNALVKEYFPGYGLVIGTAQILVGDENTIETRIQVPPVPKPKGRPRIVMGAEAYSNGDEDDDIGFGELNI